MTARSVSTSPTADPPAGSPGDTGGAEVAVGRAGRAHGVTGELAVTPLTDSPERRFAVGAQLTATLPGGGTRTLEVTAARRHGDRWLLRFAGVPDRTAAEGLGGAALSARVAADDPAGDDEEFFDHQLVGAAALDGAGRRLGVVADVLHHAAQDLLVVTPERGGPDVLVPFVAALVPVVDVAGRRVVLDPPGGLFDGGT